jgi:hypothetical protein
MAQAETCHSPYGVRATSVAQPLVLDRKDELAPFEQVQVQRLIAQLDSSTARVRTAVLKHIRQNHRSYR